MSETPSPSALPEITATSLRPNEDPASSWMTAKTLLQTVRTAIADASSDYTEVFGAIAEAAHALTHATAAALALRREGIVVCVGRSGQSAPDLGMRLSVDSGISGECLRTGKTLRCDDTQKDFRADPAVCLRLNVASIAGVPLHHDGRVIGILEAFSDRTYAFAEEHMVALQELAQLAERAYRKELGSEEVTPAVISAQAPAVVSGQAILSKAKKIAERLAASAKTTATGVATSLPKRTWTYIGAGAATAALLVISLVALRNGKPEASQTTQATTPAPVSTDNSAPLGASLTWNAKTNASKQVHSQGEVQQAAKLDKDTLQRSVPRVATSPESKEDLAPPEPQDRTPESAPPALVASNGEGLSPLVNVLGSAPALPRFTTPVSQGVTNGVLTHRVQPIYPSQAIPLRLGGAVVLDATITEDGKVRDLRLVRGNRTLAQSAIDAVSQWRYKPFLLNGKPVPMKTQITVDFKAP
jgi:TonB family protein